MLLLLQQNMLLGEAPAEDTTPDAFSFTDQNGVALSTVTTSAPITVSGINAASAISVTGGEYSVNGGAFTASPGTVDNADQVRARGTSSGSYSTAVNVAVTIGGVSDTFTITTAVDPGIWAAAGYMGGTAFSASGVMGTVFLEDAEPVPAGSHFLGGIAHTSAGLRYVALWPSSDTAYVVGGIAIRTDGAMLIAPAGTIVTHRGGVGMTARGEVVTSGSAPDLVHNCMGMLEDGKLCVLESA